MIYLFVFTPLLICIFLNYIILGKLNNCTLSLKSSLLFFVNALMMIFLINGFMDMTSIEGITNAAGLDKLIAFNSTTIKVRNSIALAGLFYLSFGIYKEYIKRKKMFLLIIFCVIILLSILYLIGSLIAGSFII